MNSTTRAGSLPARAGSTALVVIATVVALLATGAATVMPAQAAGRGAERAAGSGPLPGYTIDNPTLAPLTVRGQRARVIQGVRQSSAYDIEVPARWNGELVMWAHGYRGTGTVLTVDPPAYGLRRLFLQQGYAWAASSYARNDYDVATGVTATRDLARFVGRRLGQRPQRTYIAGVSMGGHVIGRSLEEYPGFYDGALPMCGVLGDQELFDYFLSYNLVAQELADVSAYPPPADYLTNAVPQIEQRLGLAGLTPASDDTLTAEGRQLRDVTTRLTGGARPGDDAAFAYWKDFPFTLFTPDNGGSLAQNAGRLAQNVDTDYRSASPVDLNADVRRVAPRDTFSRQTYRLTQVPRIAGRPGVPVLSLHGLGDLFVPFSMEQAYARDVARHGQRRLLVQRAVREAGHCEFTPREAGKAWNDLTRWVESFDQRRVRRPRGDRILNARTVARPRFGCRWTDQTAYQDPQSYPTRSLYQPCRGRRTPR